MGTYEGNGTFPGSNPSGKHGPPENGVPQRVQTALEGEPVDNLAGEGTTELQAYQDREVWQGTPQKAGFPLNAVESTAAVLLRVLQIQEHFAKSMKPQLNHGAFN